MTTLTRLDTPQLDPEISEVLARLAPLRASDLHITSDCIPRIRVDGQLMNMPKADVWSSATVNRLLSSMMVENQRNMFERDLELDFSISLKEDIRFRVNVYRQQGLLGAAVRVIPTAIPKLEDLGLPDVLLNFSEYPRGLVLVTGPTGSGKSTTLAALIDRINQRRAVHIMTIENPIEFTHTSAKAMINQREVGIDTKSFAEALRHVLRQDPNVILIGEMRDRETIAAALTAAETGHLVFATLHTQDAAQTIDRITDVFPAERQAQVRVQLATTLRGIISQVLIPHASGTGRVVATEVLLVTPAISNLIRENKTFQIPISMMSGGGQGMKTLDQDLARHILARDITVPTAYSVAHDREALMKLIGRETGFLASTADAALRRESNFSE
ncbi:MAG: hypothetical protein RLZZ426_325 [Actinomycetota bacterium]|jgi:twitching motility protein PilT